MDHVAYPERPSHFAHRFVRLLFRSCAVQEIGLESVSLLVLIAHTEDSKRYSGPVLYWNHELQSLMSMTWGRLDRCRRKAVETGWLRYESGGKGRVGKYWVTIPPSLSQIEDTPLGAENKTFSSSPVENKSGDEEFVQDRPEAMPPADPHE